MRRVLGILIVAVAVAGVGCTPTPGGTTLAVAYTNVDGVDGYDESADALIAKLVDTNADGVPSAGDTVITSQYPLDIDASGSGTFQVTSHVVGVFIINPESWGLTLPDGGQINFANINGSEIYSEASGAADQAFFWDNRNGANGDRLRADRDAPSKPDTEVAQINPDTSRSTTDDPFIDVDILG